MEKGYSPGFRQMVPADREMAVCEGRGDGYVGNGAGKKMWTLRV